MDIKNPSSDEVIMNALKETSRNHSMRLGTLWSVFCSWDGDEEFEDLKESVKNGFEWEFNIEKVVAGFYEEYPSSDLVHIKGHRKFSLSDFWDEIRKREKIMREIMESQIKGPLDAQEEWYDKEG